MIDRDKIIKGLECCSRIQEQSCRECPYLEKCNTGGWTCGMSYMATDAIELIKALDFNLKWACQSL